MEWLQWTKNNIKKLLWFYICFLCQIPQAHQSPQLGWWALELLCCSYHPKDLVFEDRQTMPKEWRRASEWSNLGDETNACLVLFKCLCKLIFHSCVQNVKFQMYIYTCWKSLDRTWWMLARIFAQAFHGTMRFQKANPWLRNSREDQKTDCSGGRIHAAVHSHDYFSSSQRDLRYLKASIWLSHLMQLFVGFQQANFAKLRLRITSLLGIACQCRTWPMDTNGYGKAVFTLLYFAFYLDTETVSNPLGTRKSQANIKGIPMQSISNNLCQQSKPQK